MLSAFRRHPAQAALLAAASLSVLTACGSTSTEDVSAAPTSAPAASAEPTEAAPASADPEVTAAQAVVDPYLAVPTTVNQSEPLTGKIPTDRTWVIITCELPQCQLISDGALAAAETAGVPTELLSYKTTDGATLTSAMKQALAMDPFAVSPIGFAQALWQPLVPEFKAAEVIITPIAVGDHVSEEGVVTEGSATQFDYGRDGEVMANYVTATSDAKAKILVMDVPAFAVLKAYGDGFKSEIAKVCKACTVTPLELAPAQLANNGIVPATVSALQKDKSITHLVATDGAFLPGINSALAAAGVDNVKISGGSPDINNLKALLDGSQDAWTAAAEDQYGWVALDIIARTVLGMDVPEGDGGRVSMVATRENVGEPSPTGLSAPKDYVDQYKKLWGLS